MTIRLSAHGEELLRRQLAARRYRSPEEVIEQALEILTKEYAIAPIQSGCMSPAEAVADILELRKGVTLGGLKIKDLIHEGHRV